MRKRALALLLLGLLLSPPAYAHRDDYLNETFVYRTLPRGVFDFELWADGVWRPRNPGFFRNSIALEYGVTSRFMLDGLVAFDNGHLGYNYRRTRFETRYRFGEEKPHGFSPAVSVEFEDDQLEHRKTFTPRFVINRDFNEFNVTLNVLREIELAGREGSGWGYSSGFRYGKDERRFRVGAELQQVFSRDQRSVFVPQSWIKLNDRAVLKIGYGQPLSRAQERFVRATLEIELGGKD